MEPVTTFAFTDAESGDEAWAIVRAGDGVVGLALTLRQNADVEVFLRRDDCQRLVDALNAALSAD